MITLAWPNMRVQRTRYSASLRGSPLTRHPLGRQSSLRRFARPVLVAAVLVGGGCATQSHQPLELGQAGLTSLSGDWTGVRETSQAGKCSIGERADKRWQRAQVDNEELFEIAVDSDGTITARRYLEDGILAPAPAW
jgi:hypothetical protein